MPAFVIVPASQIPAKPKKNTSGKQGRPLGTSHKQTSAQKKNTTASRSTVTVAAYGARLFEPVMTREKPIYVHFTDFVIRDEDSITRFSEDGFFAIKVFLLRLENKTRCYLAYFENPISPSPNHNLMLACQEAIEYKIFEFFDEDEYLLASQRKDKEGLAPFDAVKFRSLSALGQAEQKIIEILRERIMAEKFLKRQREFQKQNEAWKQEFEKQMKKEEAEDANLESSNNSNDEYANESEEEYSESEVEEDERVSEEAREETSNDNIESRENIKGDEIKREAPRPFVWGGGRK